MIYSNYDRMNIENTFDEYLYDGIDESDWDDDEDTDDSDSYIRGV